MAAVTLFCSFIAAPSGTAQVVDSKLWGVNGTVQAIARIGDTLYVGGVFTTVGPNTGGGVPVDRVSGAPRVPYGRVAGRVSAVVSDGAGGWFIGGHFTAVEGLSRANLAHVLADGSVSSWNPSIVGEEGFVEAGGLERRAPGVSALALRGSTLYVGGRFTGACGQSRRNLAAIEIATGALSDWNPDVDDEVRCLTLAGNTVYIGGEFRRVGDFERHYIAALSARTGAPTEWNPDAENRVRSIAIDGRTVYAGGDFVEIGGQPRTALVALDAASGQATSWDPHLGPARQSLPHYDWIWPYVSALAVRRHKLYVGGWFDRVGPQRRSCFAAFDTRSGEVTGFSPQFDSPPFALLPVGSTLYAGGDWYHVDGVAVPHVAAFDLTTERLASWNPKANAAVQALAADEANVYVGGDFTSLHDWELRDGFAALDLKTGRLVDGDPVVAGLARFNPFMAIADSFAFRLDGPLSDWVVANGRRYLAGDFIHVNGQFHPYLAAVDAATGELLPWDPWSNPENRLFGGFRVLAARENTIYVGGNFSGPLWFPRTDLAALDGTTGALLPWDPHPTGEDIYGNQTQVGVLTVRDDEVWVGGRFNRIGGEPRSNLAVLDATSGVPSPLRLDPDGVVDAIETSGDTVYIGGAFRALEGFPHCGVAALFVPRHRTLAGVTRSASWSLPLALSLDACRPNPMRAEGVIGFRLPEVGKVSLTVYDTRGRRVATILDNQATAAGVHEAPFRASGLAAGVYYCRLDASGQTLTRKLIVMK